MDRSGPLLERRSGEDRSGEDPDHGPRSSEATRTTRTTLSPLSPKRDSQRDSRRGPGTSCVFDVEGPAFVPTSLVGLNTRNDGLWSTRNSAAELAGIVERSKRNRWCFSCCRRRCGHWSRGTIIAVAIFVVGGITLVLYLLFDCLHNTRGAENPHSPLIEGAAEEFHHSTYRLHDESLAGRSQQQGVRIGGGGHNLKAAGPRVAGAHHFGGAGTLLGGAAGSAAGSGGPLGPLQTGVVHGPLPLQSVGVPSLLSGEISLKPPHAPPPKIEEVILRIGLDDKLLDDLRNLVSSQANGAALAGGALDSTVVADFLQARLSRFTKLQVERFERTEKPNRASLKIKLKNERSGGHVHTVGFLGARLDLVGGSGSSRTGASAGGEDDVPTALGHVAILVSMLEALATERGKLGLGVDIVVVFPADAEGAERELLKAGHLDELVGGPVYHISGSGSQPCCGSRGASLWQLEVASPSTTTNALQLSTDALRAMQDWFYGPAASLTARHRVDGGPTAAVLTAEQTSAAQWGFATDSSLSATSIDCEDNGPDAAPTFCAIGGDLRLTPFRGPDQTRREMESFVAELNADMSAAVSSATKDSVSPRRRSRSPFRPAPSVRVGGASSQTGAATPPQLKLSWLMDAATRELYEGFACDLASPGHKALVQSVREVVGVARPHSILGTLAEVGLLRRSGLDVQVIGFGDGEHTGVERIRAGLQVLGRVLGLLGEL